MAIDSRKAVFITDHGSMWVSRSRARRTRRGAARPRRRGRAGVAGGCSGRTRRRRGCGRRGTLATCGCLLLARLLAAGRLAGVRAGAAVCSAAASTGPPRLPGAAVRCEDVSSERRSAIRTPLSPAFGRHRSTSMWHPLDLGSPPTSRSPAPPSSMWRPPGSLTGSARSGCPAWSRRCGPRPRRRRPRCTPTNFTPLVSRLVGRRSSSIALRVTWPDGLDGQHLVTVDDDEAADEAARGRRPASSS